MGARQWHTSASLERYKPLNNAMSSMLRHHWQSIWLHPLQFIRRLNESFVGESTVARTGLVGNALAACLPRAWAVRTQQTDATTGEWNCMTSTVHIPAAAVNGQSRMHQGTEACAGPAYREVKRLPDGHLADVVIHLRINKGECESRISETLGPPICQNDSQNESANIWKRSTCASAAEDIL